MSTAEGAPGVGKDTPRPWTVLTVLLAADTVYGFQQTAITPALPVIQDDFGASREWTIWLFSGYLIVASVAPVFLGKVADRAGLRRVYVIALAVFLLGSVGGALAPSILVLVLCRLVQGVGGAVFPLSFAIATKLLPPHRVRSGIGMLTSGFGLGALIGFPLGGFVTEALSWRWIFGLGTIALSLATVLVRSAVPRLGERVRRGLDTPGAVLFGGAMATLIIAITEGPQRGWFSPVPVGMFVLAGCLAIGWYFREIRTAEPLMDLRVLGSRGVLLANLTSLLSGYAVFGVNLLLPFLLESPHSRLTAFGLAAGPLLTGIVLIPRALGQTIGGPLTGPLSRLVGQALVFSGGMLLVAGAAAGLAFWRGQLWMILLELAVLGLGFSLTISTSGAIVALAANPGETGIAISITSVLRRVGGGVGAQVSIALLAAITLPGSSRPAPTAFTTAFVTATVIAVAGAVCAIFVVPLHRGRQPSGAPQ